MDEVKVYLSKPQVITAGRHKIKVTPPNLKWWMEGISIITGLYGRAMAIQKMQDFNALSIASIFRQPSIDVLNHLALTTNKRPLLPWKPRGAWFIDNMTPVELGVFVQGWLDVVNIAEIKDVFLKAGEKAGLKGILTKPTPDAGSPAPLKPSPMRPDGV